MTRIHIIDADDWREVSVNGASVHSNHSIPQSVWVKLLQDAGCEVTVERVEICAYCSQRFPEGSGKLEQDVCPECRAEAD